MKVAIASDDGKNISQHFGRAAYYIVYTIENDKVVSKEVREKVGHHSFIEAPGSHSCHDHGGEHGMDAESQNKHVSMLSAAEDCNYIVAGHMGGGAYHSMVNQGIEPLLTDVKDADQVVKAIVEDRFQNEIDRLH
ncbi:putative Fe-Mo cluster-binding protein, NifX family [Dehalogenimonas formicexedens]|uniref:Putative Fe-Mo cluster-binding protein, NifX family n=1 Tax=Dehalogenimonas formicexedens TaxID=1839801 RepID=A0A1P8F4U6_9CHLR|nr:NifB/NifX family molybdenum-iron cluster-binding protein [Dehalogenimonas formicexedens]APV43475.1 putative Fe-Mo cluster-binding protein, NifX family [Dehalogenimonas formicexedens]